MKALVLVTLFFCTAQNLVAQQVNNSDCKGLMQPANNEYNNMPYPVGVNVPTGFVMVIDPKLKTSNFITLSEEYMRSQSVKVDTSAFYLMFNKWKHLSISEKFEFIEKRKIINLAAADSIHKVNNPGKQLVYVINNTDSEVKIGVQDRSFICVLEALDKNKQWKPMQYWRYSTCGNSYMMLHFLPKTAVAFVALRINTGDYKTKLRYKLSGADKFYYSNEFEGSINYCEFQEDMTYNSHPSDTLENFEVRKFDFFDMYTSRLN